jgi:hypothetical protein
VHKGRPARRAGLVPALKRSRYALPSVNGKSDIARMRLRNQGIADPRFTSPHAVVSWFGAIQAQDYLGALWAVGLRMKKAVEADIERALAERKIVRSWPLRGTLHFVAAEDLKWMLELLGPRMIGRNAARLKRAFELDASALRRCRTAVIRALEGGQQLTRGEFYDALGRARIRTNASRGLHIIFSLAQERLICFGPRRAKQHTFVLLDEWAPGSTNLKGDEALHELARRYFASHSPATAADFAWWSGLPVVEAKRAAEMVGALRKRKRAAIPTPSAWLLPAFDEYLVGYKDRSAVLDPAYVKRVNAGGGLLNPTIVIDGEVVGTWKRIMKRDGVAITRSLFRPLKKGEERLVSDAEERYTNFVGRNIRDRFA